MSEQTPSYAFPWLAHYDDGVPASIEYEKLPLYAYLDRAAANHPNRTAIIFRNKKITYKKLQVMAETVAANLRRHGVEPGDRVSIMMPNLPQTVAAFWGVLKAGAVVVMTNPLYMEKELVHQIEDSGAKHMIALDLVWPKLEKLRDKLPIKKYFITRISESLGFPLNLLYTVKSKRDASFQNIPFDGKTILPWKQLAEGKDRLSAPIADPTETLALLQYTGGTTGIAKGVMLTHYNLGVNAQQCNAMLKKLASEHHTFLGILPYFHVFGLTVCLVFPTLLASTVIPFPRFVPKDVLDGIQKYKPTIFPGAPSVYIALMQQKEISKYDLTCIRYCISGSSPMPVEQMKRFAALTGASIIEGFGLTEASPVTHLNPIDSVHKIGSIGVPFPDTEARIVDMELGFVPVPAGKIGELVIRGPQVMKGYWNRPDETASTLRNGWLYTGDIANMDEDGYFFIVDRKKDMIIVGGYNVYPREIDEVLYEHPKVQEAVTVGVPHPTRGEIIKAYVVPKAGEKLTKGEIIAHCREQLANYKLPKQVEFREELPKTIVGKVLRRALRAEEEQRISEAEAEAAHEEKASMANFLVADDLVPEDAAPKSKQAAESKANVTTAKEDSAESDTESDNK
ncbi:long-chain fatty acid--CoA ligase [Desulfovibrio mangrovi]|uniref:long-chain-fatty-acid--CoA ligase n=1 Tax=Desulfovibrio mangrovi TaxID=2976983 RepID=UPI002247D9A4|nr:long-chain fatty acid--CoA ligase [Desulfovibrio mangrovi]UZP68191.1 long-chain fatty acid--CoA ligase [Desulfovibrio mangrovi]